MMTPSRPRALAFASAFALGATLLAAGPTGASVGNTQPSASSAPARTLAQVSAEKPKKGLAKIRVLTFNDFHGRLESAEGLGGAPALAAQGEGAALPLRQPPHHHRCRG